MNNKSKLIWGGIVILALIFAGFLWYQSYARKSKLLSQSAATEEKAGAGENTAAVAENVDNGTNNGGEEEVDYNAICENGEWVKITDQSDTLSTAVGMLRKVYPDDPSSQFKNYLFYVEGAENLGITGEKLFKLDYFEGREVEIQGVKNSEKKEIAISEVKCAGKETDKNIIEGRKKLMGYLAANINTIAPQKAKYQKWTIDIVDFVDEKNVYVEYYDTVEDDENSDINEDTSRRILAEAAARADGKYDTKVLAYWEMGEDDYVLKNGTDKFKDADIVASYQYDPEKKTWERID